MNSWILYGFGGRLDHIALLSIKVRFLSGKYVERAGPPEIDVFLEP
jgi:hypothetical protein